MNRHNDGTWPGTRFRHSDENILENRLRERESALEPTSAEKDEAVVCARVNFHTALSRMKVLRASFEAAHQRQERERRVFREQFSRTRKELLTAYRLHRSLIRDRVTGASRSQAQPSDGPRTDMP